jgi:hypothetical protein
MKFQIEYVGPDEKNAYVLARQLEPGDFSLTSESRLGSVLIKPILSSPRKVRADGTLDLSLFSFALAARNHLAQFSVGQIVDLHP